RRRDRARSNPLQQGRHRGGVAEARAVVDVVGAEPDPDQLLEKIGLLVRSLGRAEPRQRSAAMGVANTLETRSGARQRLLPTRLAEMGPWVRRIDGNLGRLRRILAPDQRLGQAVAVVHVIEAENALVTQPCPIG